MGWDSRGDCAALWDVLLDTSAVSAWATTLDVETRERAVFPKHLVCKVYECKVLQSTRVWVTGILG